MLHGSHHPGVAGSELTRLLSRLADAPPAGARSVFAERLGHWLGWTDAIALSTALNAGAGVSVIGGASANGTRANPGPVDAASARSTGAGNHEADFQRVRAALQASIAAGPAEPVSSPTDFSPYRRHCANRQQAMQEAVGALRQRLRAALARHSPALARLADLDAAMDQALAAHERRLLGLVPARLQTHFERLQRAAGDGDTAWAAAFRDDMDHVLQAELAHRLLPAQGLLDTLRTEHIT